MQVVILMAMCESATAANKHMQVFAKLARRLMNEKFRAELLNAQDVLTTFTYLTRELGLQVEPA